MGRREGLQQPAEARTGVPRSSAALRLRRRLSRDLRADHSELEDRFIAIGPVDGRLVVVWYTEPDEGVIRIIGARRATNRERDLFRSRMDQER